MYKIKDIRLPVPRYNQPPRSLRCKVSGKVRIAITTPSIAWSGFNSKYGDNIQKRPVLLRCKSKREGSLRELFSPHLMLAIREPPKLILRFGEPLRRQRFRRKCATQGSPVVVSQSNFAKVFARFLGRLPLLIARFICHRQHSQTSPNSKRKRLECVDSKYEDNIQKRQG